MERLVETGDFPVEAMRNLVMRDTVVNRVVLNQGNTTPCFVFAIFRLGVRSHGKRVIGSHEGG